MKKRILTVSSANMDLVYRVKRFPKAGETVTAEADHVYLPGGKGANSAITVARLGGSSILCTAVGDDLNGRTLTALYGELGIDTSFIAQLRDHPTGLACVTVDEDGSNRIIVSPGANLHIPSSTVVSALGTLPDALFMQLEISADAVLLAAHEAAKRHIPIFIDAGPAKKDFPLSELPQLTVFSPNESETETFTGIRPTDEASCIKAAKALARFVRANYYVIKLGSRGCFLTDLNCAITVPAFDNAVVDTTAAGDAFTAALTLEYLKSDNIIDAARFANAVGALVVGKLGAAPSIPTSSEVKDFLKVM